MSSTLIVMASTTTRQTNFTGYLKRHTEKGGRIHVNEIELQCLEGDQCGEYAVKFILDGLPMKRGVVNKKWREYVAWGMRRVGRMTGG